MSQEEEIRSLVRQVVSKTLGTGQVISSRVSGTTGRGGSQPLRRREVLDADIVRSMPSGSVQIIPSDCLVTPLARQVALERRIKLQPTAGQVVIGQAADGQVVALGADHGGYALKETIKEMLAATGSGYRVIDCGTHSTDSVDYPDLAYAVASTVANGRAWRGILIDGAGIGSAMAANKVPGVRAALCYDQATAINSREHNNANVLTLGAGLIGVNLAKQIVNTWLTTEFGGGRHARRVDKIDAIGRRFSSK